MRPSGSKHPVEWHCTGDFNEKLGSRIESVQLGEAPAVYVLFDPQGRHVATCSSPLPLAAHAFDAGAIDVHHAYDLRTAEREYRAGPPKC